MDFIIAFFWYFLAFVLGAVVARILAASVVKPQSSTAAFADLDAAHPKGATA